MTINATAAAAISEIARNNDLVLETAQQWAERGYAVRVQVLSQPGERLCRVCVHLIGAYTLGALPETPDAGCERAAGCICVYHLILLV